MDDDKPGCKWILTEAELLPLCLDEENEAPIMHEQLAVMAERMNERVDCNAKGIIDNLGPPQESSAPMEVPVESQNDDEVNNYFTSVYHCSKKIVSAL